VHHDDRLSIVERHLGLMPSNETGAALDKIAAIAGAVSQQVDLDRLCAVAAAAPALAADPVLVANHGPASLPKSTGAAVRLGIARDEAFGFYYPGDLHALSAAGAELVPFNTLRDKRLPDVDALFIGGGFPEVHLESLAANLSLKRDIRNAIESGIPAYAECGGLMYLSRQLRWGERVGEMVGVIPGDTVMHDKPQGRGYAKLRETGLAPWPLTRPGSDPAEIPAHEFHYSSLDNLPNGLTFAYEMKRGHGLDGRHDGIVHKNLLACYCHLRDLEGNHWASRFMDFARRHKISSKAHG
jgi:cobyrinic acid a,c-diamide synthase